MFQATWFWSPINSAPQAQLFRKWYSDHQSYMCVWENKVLIIIPVSLPLRCTSYLLFQLIRLYQQTQLWCNKYAVTTISAKRKLQFAEITWSSVANLAIFPRGQTCFFKTYVLFERLAGYLFLSLFFRFTSLFLQNNLWPGHRFLWVQSCFFCHFFGHNRLFWMTEKN